MSYYNRVINNVRDKLKENGYTKSENSNDNQNKNGLYESNVSKLFNGIFKGADTIFKGKDSKYYDGSLKNKIDLWFNNALTGDLDYQRQLNFLDKEMAFNSAEAEKNRQFNLQTSNSAFQRQAEDLAKTGYNPALVLGGSGATVLSSSPGHVNSHSSFKSGQGFERMLSLLVGSAISLAQSSMKNSTLLALESMRNEKILTAKDKAFDDYAYAHYGRNIIGLQPLKSKHSTYANVKTKKMYDSLSETDKKMFDFFNNK